jgi:hypothetical protein
LGDAKDGPKAGITPHVHRDGAPNAKHGKRGFLAMTRRAILILLASILVVCVLCPYVEDALDFNQSIFDSGYDTESTVAIVALVVILAFDLARLLVSCLSDATGEEHLVESKGALRLTLDFISTVPAASPPLPLRI